MEWLYSWYLMIPFGLVSIAIFIEDLRFREIKIIWPILLVLIAFIGAFISPTKISVFDVLLNFLYLNILFAALFLVQLFRGLPLKSIINKKIGFGDLIIPYCLIPYFDPYSFMVFIPAGSALILAIQLSPIRSSKIPFAGNIMALAFLWVLGEWYWGPISNYFFFK